MNTPTPRTDAAWSATFNGEQMSAGQTARTLREHSRQLEAELAALTAERDQLRAEVERLRSDRDCEKRLRKDADEFRENAIARALAAEDNLAALEQCHDDNCRGVVKIADELATERARLDWLQAQEVKRDLEITEGRDDPLPFLVLGEDGTTHWGDTYRAAIDAAMKEGAK